MPKPTKACSKVRGFEIASVEFCKLRAKEGDLREHMFHVWKEST